MAVALLATSMVRHLSTKSVRRGESLPKIQFCQNHEYNYKDGRDQTIEFFMKNTMGT